jgi:hypothetical protein
MASLNFIKQAENIGTPSRKIYLRDYDNNDLGINFYNNFNNLYSSYRILNPTKQFNTFRFQNEFSLAYDNTTGKLQEATTSQQLRPSAIIISNLV